MKPVLLWAIMIDYGGATVPLRRAGQVAAFITRRQAEAYLYNLKSSFGPRHRNPRVARFEAK